jgi:hypothetical protein
VLCLALATRPGRSDPPAALPAPAADPDVLALANKIDELIAARWAEKGVTPAPLADDAEFMRRVYLDLAGRIPLVSEARDFLDDRSPDKRRRLVDDLLNSPLFLKHFSNVWRDMMLPPNNNQQFQLLVGGFESWLVQRLSQNTPYDQLVRELLTVPLNNNGGGRQLVQFNGNLGQPTPLIFYQANEQKPENLAASTSRLFLGVKLECAQCHDHPFAKWSRKQFWELAAFFSGIQGGRGNGFGPVAEVADRREIKIVGTDKVVQARFLDGTEPAWKAGVNARTTLADWLTAADNPFFARAGANRLWAHFFGIGLIEPVDEPGDNNPPSHPELLDELGRQFAGHKFDVKFLIRALTASKAYQRTSTLTHATQDDPRVFARMVLKGMSGEQLWDSLKAATGYPERAVPNQRFAFGVNTPRGEFLAKFAAQDKRTEHHTSILQALSLMNGRLIGDLTDVTNLEKPVTLSAVIDFPAFDTTEKKVEVLFLTTLSRKPRPEEAERFVRYVNKGGAKNDPKSALADVFWALLNSSEFILNH